MRLYLKGCCDCLLPTAYCQDPIHYFLAITQQQSELLIALLSKLQTQNLKKKMLFCE